MAGMIFFGSEKNMTLHNSSCFEDCLVDFEFEISCSNKECELKAV
jgi:hypothetical protein